MSTMPPASNLRTLNRFPKRPKPSDMVPIGQMWPQNNLETKMVDKTSMPAIITC